MKYLALVLFCACLVATCQALSGCDPIDPSACFLPFPNNFWLRQGVLAMSEDSLPKDNTGKGIDPTVSGWSDLDGFAAASPIITYLGEISAKSLPSWKNISASLEQDCPTVLLDASTGERVAHWAELDVNSGGDTDPVQRALTIFPAARLSDGTRYLVAVRGVTLAATGELVEASTAFAALRDNTTSNDNDVNNRRDHFAGIFDKLTVAGVDTAELQIAWDFTTMSKSGVSNRLVTMRDDAFNRTAEGVEYKIAQVVDDFSENIARKVEVYIKVPQYVNEVRPSKQLHLVLDADGVPQYQGDEWYAFTLLIPWSVFNDTAEDRSVLQYGHGLFYSRKEVESGYLQEQAQLHGYVMVASNWLGLSETDAPYIAEMLSSDLSKFQMVPDRCQQGVLLALLVMRTMQQGHIYSEAALADVNGKPILQANPDMYYTGNSCGGILGTVYMAASTDVQRAVIGVGGGPFSLLLPRSKDFELLFTDLKLRYAEPLARSFLFAWLQQLWIRADPAGYAGYVTKNTLPNTKKHTLVFQSGLGDAQVSVLGVYFLARSTDAVMFKSNVVFADTTLYGFDFVADDVTVNNASTAVTWQWSDVPEDPLHNFPANEEYDTHDNPRKDTNAQDMMYHFFNTGNTVNTCEGPCFVKV